MQDFQQLHVWKRAHALVLRIYTLSANLPSGESFGLTLNLRRSAVSIPRAIADGAGRESEGEFAQELKRARAAGHELEYLLLLCRDLGFIADAEHGELTMEVIEIRRMLSGLVRRVQS